MRPAEVWGWRKYPRVVKSDISFRIVAGEIPRLNFLSKACEPTGSAVSIYSSIIALRICVCLAVSPSVMVRLTSFTHHKLFRNFKLALSKAEGLAVIYHEC